MKVGDLVKYMSRVLLVVGAEDNRGRVSCVEVGEPPVIGRYDRNFLKVINKKDKKVVDKLIS